MDITNRRPQLPALSYLDIDKVKREEEAYQIRHTGATQTHHSAPAASPTTQYPSGPPPPYSHPPPQHANSWPGVKSGVHTPPDSRRSSGDANENVKQTTRQSLPSISEALGVDSQTSYPPATSTALQPPPPTHLSQPLSAAPSSPSAAARRSYAMEPPQLHNPYSNSSSYQYSSFRQDSAGPQTHPPPPQQETRPPLHLQTSQPGSHSHPSTSYSYPSSTSPQYEQPSSHSANSMGPPSVPYGYTPYPPRYAQQTTSPGRSSGPIYQPSAQYGAPHTPSSSAKSDGASSRFATDERSTAATYGESVKRHLDLYELEGALTEIAETSGIMMDFTRRYGSRMHQSARSEPTLSTLPGLVEIEDMMTKSRVQMDSLVKIREVVIAQQVAFEQQAADRRQQRKVFAESHPPPTEQHVDEEDMKGGYAEPDTKKRRGRTAPPGRCHSCNRAETPEWRRGPDGARTLCNACGLHYAKLTRKQTGANKSSNVGSSNLRPKEV